MARAFGGEQDLFGLAAMGGPPARKLDEKELDPGRFSPIIAGRPCGGYAAAGHAHRGADAVRRGRHQQFV